MIRSNFDLHLPAPSAKRAKSRKTRRSTRELLRAMLASADRLALVVEAPADKAGVLR